MIQALTQALTLTPHESQSVEEENNVVKVLIIVLVSYIVDAIH